MQPIHDVDVLLLLSLAIASKKRPAELVEIMAAADLIQGFIPSEKLGGAFQRLSSQGLICEAEGCYTLTPQAQEVVSCQTRKADMAARIAGLREKLFAYTPSGEHTAIQLSAEQLAAAIVAHRTAGQGAGRNLGMPKPKQAQRSDRRPGQWRKSGPTRARKS